MGRALLAAALALAAGCAAAQDQAAQPNVRTLSEAAYPEGPLVVGERVLVAEMGADRIRAHPLAGPRSPPQTFFAESGCGPTALAPYGEGFVVLCHLSGDLAIVGAAGGPVLRRFGSGQGVALRNPNDATADGRGGVYFSDPGPFSRRRQPQGQIVRLTPDGRLVQAAAGLSYPNGVFFDRADNALYVSEHLARRVLRFPVLADGALGPAQTVLDLGPFGARPEGARFAPYDHAGPDGLERLADGSWALAIYGEGRVLRLRPDWTIAEEIPTPFAFVTNVAEAAPMRLIIVGAHDNQAPPFPGAVLMVSIAPTR